MEFVAQEHARTSGVCVLFVYVHHTRLMQGYEHAVFVVADLWYMEDQKQIFEEIACYLY